MGIDTLLMTGLKFGGGFSIGDNKEVCIFGDWPKCAPARWGLIGGFGVLFLFEVTGYVITVFILQARLTKLTLNIFREAGHLGLDPVDTCQILITQRIQVSRFAWEQYSWFVITGALYPI